MADNKFPTFEQLLRESQEREIKRNEVLADINKQMNPQPEVPLKQITKKSKQPKQKVVDKKKRFTTFKKNLDKGLSKISLKNIKNKGIDKRYQATSNLLRFTGIIPPQQQRTTKRIKPSRTSKQPRQPYQSNRNKNLMLEEYKQLRKKQLLDNMLKHNQQSPSYRQLMENLIRIQNKSKTDFNRFERIKRERDTIGRQMNLMKAHENLNKVRMDFTKLPEGDLSILSAPNIFKELQENNILKNQRLNILQTKEAGNLLFF